MHSVPISLFLVLFVQTTTGELSLPSLPEAVQLLQLETIRGLEQTILEKEDENRRLEEMIRSVEMEKEAVTHNNTMMEEEMERILSERENVIGELESRLQFLEKDGTVGELEERIQGLEMEKCRDRVFWRMISIYRSNWAFDLILCRYNCNFYCNSLCVSVLCYAVHFYALYCIMRDEFRLDQVSITR